LTYFESARIDYVMKLFGIDHATELNMILAKMTVEYRLPLTLGDEIVVYTRCSRLGNKSFDLEAVILRYAGDEAQTAATGHAVMVAYDYARAETVPLPESWRERLLAYEPGLA